ncbi:50S ribosomal protein L15 [Candidatus Berkelbacteria bacterium CG06_land_8_20_14_3_00_43_10]|uniref:Large ribosomal subunit protein uL15 n=1 Tax=Candidatus Berkelbacteria bacterium CG10_big_fil_rev_8_21_14_0_10_43_14 TaxID=1974515 RepID=A0A2M6R8R5_9BACT|nr:MAG: 50S ribosomal protein L15 [Candidatus Berkelbacteria bacterium CG2_30_43_20]PIS06923.1 MAG: 50S ribosomal protein L15 [Candidatus Berkelbacteria bacterium CG10_big_fil_rev_8_21_14_0_10_43_14]PIU87396.1 MAG: 50S ribosomal protein L15 [Candidatus Berkelbacteria bacterium CG06_land_8_20_14_3_00_43_10]
MAIVTITKSLYNSTKKRVGRGVGTGKGKTSGRGTKGQKSRTGYKIPRLFEGGQTSIIARLPKAKGFSSSRIQPQTVALSRLVSLAPKTIVNKKLLFSLGIINNPKQSVKIVDSLESPKDISFRGVILTQSVQEKYKHMVATH